MSIDQAQFVPRRRYEDEPLSREQREERASARTEYLTSLAIDQAQAAGCECQYPDVWLVRRGAGGLDFEPVINHRAGCPLADDDAEPDNRVPVPIGCPGCGGRFIFRLDDWSAQTWKPIQMALENECPSHEGRTAKRVDA